MDSHLAETPPQRRRFQILPFIRNLLLSMFVACPTSITLLADEATAQSTTWAIANINTSGTGTFSNPNSGQYTLNAAGNGLSGTADSISFLKIKTSGNVEMVTKVASLQSGTPDFAPAGLSIRNDNTSAGAMHASIVLTPKNGINFLSRSSSGGATAQTLGPSIDPSVQPWLRIVKSEQSIAGYYSLDGSNWTLVGQTELSLADTFNIGFVGASLLDPTLRSFAFTNSVFMRDVPQRNADMALWLRADAGVSKSGSSVSGWQDQSNSVYTASQPTAANQPALAPGALNGLPALNFAGSDKFMQLPSGYANFDRGTTIFAVMKPPTSAVANARIFDFANGSTNGAFRLYQPTKSKNGLSLQCR